MQALRSAGPGMSVPAQLPSRLTSNPSNMLYDSDPVAIHVRVTAEMRSFLLEQAGPARSVSEIVRRYITEAMREGLIRDLDD